MKKSLAILLLFLPLIAAAQQEDAIRAKAADYFEKFPEERLFVHLAKPEILAGEDLWFRIFHYQPQDNQPLPFSKVAYMEIITPQGEHVTGVRVKLDASGGNGYISIPATLNSGTYLVKAYTRWMKNFDPAGYFTARINVINTFKPLGLTTPPDSARVSMVFMPEGGDIIAGNKTRVGLLFLDGRKNGIASTGVILDRDSNRVAAFNTDHRGMGLFEFQPEAGQSYMAAIRRDSANIREFPLPAVRPRGISLQAKLMEDHYSVRMQEKGTVPGRRYLAILARGEFRFIQSFASGESEIMVKLEDLAEGVNQLTLFNNEGEPVAERLLYRKPENALDLSVELNKTRFDVREKVEVTITSRDGNNQIVPADVSVSVIPGKSLAGGELVDFPTYMWLGSALDMDLSTLNISLLSEEQIEKLLLIFGWRRYNWEDVKSASYEYIPELREPLIAGTISGREPGPVYFGYQDTLSNIAVTNALDNGAFYMETPNYYGNREIIIRHTDSVKRELVLQPLFHEGYDPVPTRHFYVGPQSADYLARLSENLQVENIFSGTKPVSRAYDESFYGKPSVSYDLDDFTRFPVMEEVVREYVYGVYVRKRQGRFTFSVLDETSNDAMDTPPMILLDGIPGFTPDEILALDPLKIRRIEVYRGMYGTGPVMSGGIVAFYSYNRDLAGIELTENAIRQQYQGLQPYKEFFSPLHQNSSRMPDFRTQLYWAPQVQTTDGKADIQFFTSDIPGEYLIHVQGLGSHGYAGSTTTLLVIE
jgi:hypothetical protein